jgi:CheY-like chemotaxis protein
MTLSHSNPDIPSFESLFDLKEIQDIQDSFAAATGVASIITDVEGKPITTPSNFCRLCRDIIRGTENGLFNCMQSDCIIGRYHEGGPVIQPCLSGGLWDAGVSVHVGRKHIANWLIGQVHQVAMNLMTNALHAMEEMGGELRVDLSQIEVEKEGVQDLGIKPGSYICLKIADNGSGMDEKTRKRIFEPYFTTKVRGKGTGLGLAVVHGIVKKLGGEIGVKTEMGQGSEFSIYLPRIMSNGEDGALKAVGVMPAFRNEHILVVDDEDAVLNMLDQALSRMGCRVSCQNSSLKALELFKSDPKRFDLVITDMTMPDLTGDKLITGIKKIRPGVPVILCSGFNEKLLNQKATGTKPDKILMKPVTKNDLAQALVMLLEK